MAALQPLSVREWDVLEPLGPPARMHHGARRSYRARDRHKQVEAALTLLDLALPSNIRLAEEYRRGVASYRALIPSDGILDRVDCFDHESWFIVVNPYLPGARLIREWLNAGYMFTEREVVNAGLQIARALETAHGKEIVFGSITPGSILYEPASGRTAVASLPRTRPDLSSILDVARFLGVPYYHPPEVITDNRLSPAADVYSACMTLYAMCTGTHPFVETTDAGAACMSIVNDKTPPIPSDADVSPALMKVIHEGLAKDPAERIPNGAVLRARLAAIQPHARRVASDERTWAIAAKRYPFPIAKHVQLFSSAAEEAFQLTQLQGISEAVAKFLGALVLAELRELKIPHDLGAKLRRPSLGHWAEAAREGLRVLADRRDALSCPELIDLFRGSGKQSELLDQLITWRNKEWGHGRHSDQEGIQGAVAEGRRISTRLLRALGFLSRYRLLHAESMEWKQDRFIVRLTHLVGATAQPARVTLERPLRTGEVLFTDPDFGRAVSLDGYFFYSTCPECKQRDLFLYQSENDGERDYLGFHRNHRLSRSEREDSE